MKKYLQNRNEQLFNKLFESQGINISLEENEEDIPFNPEDDTQDQMDSDVIHDIETSVMDGVRNMIRQGASPQQMERLLKGVDAAILYGFAGSHGSYNSPFMGKSLEEIGVPEMTAWQAIEEEDLTESRTRAIIKEEWAKEGHQPLTEEQLDEILVEIFGNPFKKTGDKDGFDDIEAAQEIDATAKDAVMGLFKKFTTNNQRMKAMIDAFDALPIEKQKEAGEKAENAEDKEDAQELAAAVVDASKDEKGKGRDAAVMPIPVVDGSKSGNKSLQDLLKQAGAKEELIKKIVKSTISQLRTNNIQIAERESDGAQQQAAGDAMAAAGIKTYPDSERVLAALTSNDRISGLISKLDNPGEIQAFLISVIDAMIAGSGKVNPEKINLAVRNLPKAIKKLSQHKAKDASPQGPEDSKGAFDGKGIRNIITQDSETTGGTKRNIIKALTHWMKTHLKDKNLKLTEETESLVSSILVGLVRLKKEAVHVLADPDTKEDEEEVELDTGELEDEFAADETAEEEDMLTEQIKPRKKGKTKRKVVIRYGKSKKTKRT